VGDRDLSGHNIAVGLERATKFALAPGWVYHVTLSPEDELRDVQPKSHTVSQHFSP